MKKYSKKKAGNRHNKEYRDFETMMLNKVWEQFDAMFDDWMVMRNRNNNIGE